MEMEAVFARDGLRAVAPAEQIKKQDEDRDMEQRSIAEQRMATSSYTIQFLDVIQTGRKTWVEIYIDSPNDIITIKTLNRIRDEIRNELRKSFDQIYVEIIPDLPE